VGLVPETVFQLPVMDRWLLHAPLVGLDVLMNRAAVDALVTGQPVHGLQELRLQLADSPPPPQPRSGDFDPDFLGFITTRACNIGCLYCDFGGPTAKPVIISPDVILSAIDWYADHLVTKGRRQFKVHLFGGEPFRAPEAVDLILHRTRQVCARRGLQPWFEVSTNGVFPESRAEFVGDYFDVVVLSFDGPPEFHDRNRPGFDGRPTFDVVERTARRLAASPVELCLRACVTQESVEHMEDITDWMCREFHPAVINHEPLTQNALTQSAGLAPPDPYAFAVHWMRSRRIAARYGIKLVYSAAEAERPQVSSCPVGSDTMIISPNGRTSACYMLPEDWQSRGMDFDLGHVHARGLVEIDVRAAERIRQFVADKPRCETCFCRWSCAGGCHVTHSYLNCPTDYNDFCRQTRIITACLALECLGADELIDGLLASPHAMQQLADQPDDGLRLEELTC
jgi:uncharacterized protein